MTDKPVKVVQEPLAPLPPEMPSSIRVHLSLDPFASLEIFQIVSRVEFPRPDEVAGTPYTLYRETKKLIVERADAQTAIEAMRIISRQFELIARNLEYRARNNC